MKIDRCPICKSKVEEYTDRHRVACIDIANCGYSVIGTNPVERHNELCARLKQVDALTEEVERLRKWYNPPKVNDDYMCHPDCPYHYLREDGGGLVYDECTIYPDKDYGKPHPDCIAAKEADND